MSNSELQSDRPLVEPLSARELEAIVGELSAELGRKVPGAHS